MNDTTVTNDGFQKVVNRKRNNKGSLVGNKLPKGVLVSKGFQVRKELAFQSKATSSNDKKKISNIASPNPFAVLGVDDNEEEEVRQVVNENNLSDCAILESHVDVVAVYDTCKKVCSRWKWTSNGSLCVKGSRISLGWNGDLVDVMIMAQTNQEFKECVQAMEVADFINTNLHFTWNKKPKGSNGILKKIDRIMGNLQFNNDFPRSFSILAISYLRSFAFCSSYANEGCAMFRVVKRLKGLKSPFRKLLHNHENLHERVNKIHSELDEAQKAIDRDPSSSSSSILHEIHAHYLLAFKEAQLDEERFLKQKAKIEWLKTGDFNKVYFHMIVKSKCTKNRIEIVSDASNNLYDGNQVLGAFVNHYNQFLGVEGVTIPLDDYDLFTHVLDMPRLILWAPGPDSFVAAFFMKAWDVVGGDITCVIWDFFSNEQIMRGFLWCQREMKKGKAKVTWDSFCMPKHEGGLDIRRIDDFNVTLMVTHIWSILTHRESLWVKWVHMYKLKCHSFWDVPCRGDDMFSNRDIARSYFSLDDSVNNLISDGVWRWPLDWLSRSPIMAQLQVPLLLDDIDDIILWRDRDGVLRHFSMACAWDTIRTRADIVNWCGLRFMFFAAWTLFHLSLLMLILSLLIYPRAIEDSKLLYCSRWEFQ
nr:hypothetical protein [Tanacetum cinerariifolium]